MPENSCQLCPTFCNGGRASGMLIILCQPIFSMKDYKNKENKKYKIEYDRDLNFRIKWF
jgi:hypothetical protein